MRTHKDKTKKEKQPETVQRLSKNKRWKLVISSKFKAKEMEIYE